MFKKLTEWIEVRVGLEEIVRQQLKDYKVPKNINIFYSLGFVALAGFVMQVITGFFLLSYYIPHPDHAFRSVQHIMNNVPYGWLFRQMHVVGSNLMVTAVILHMLSVLFMGSYKKPREMTWMVGAAMLLLTLTFCLSGYLLPWSQLSYWATTIVTSIPTAFPYIGDFIAKIQRGGDSVSGVTLSRFFALHVTLLPFILASLIGIHLFLIRRIGISSPPYGASGEEKMPWTEFHHDGHPDGHPFYPYFITKELSMVMVYCAVIFFIVSFMPTLFLPDDANTPADPFKTPAHIKPEWYFLAAYQMLKTVPGKFLGISLQMLIVGLFIILPLLDRGEERNILKRPVMLGLYCISLILLAVFTIWGKYS